MPFIAPPATAGKKRRRVSGAEESSKSKSRSKTDVATAPDTQIEVLETQIFESRRHYNNIATLLSLAKPETNKESTRIEACVSLCKVFCRLLSAGSMTKSKNTPEEEVTIIRWLRERYNDYIGILLQYLQSDSAEQNTASTLLLQLVKQETNQGNGNVESRWKEGTFPKLVEALLDLDGADHIKTEFIEKANEYDDIRYYTFWSIASLLSQDFDDAELTEVKVSNAILFLSAMDPARAKTLSGNFFSEASEQTKKSSTFLPAHLKQAQQAWMGVLRGDLTTGQRKNLLSIMSRRIVPWFIKPELLSDFLTDSFNVGGSLSILSLSGVFDLIQKKNLDYPSFYQKLYSLLDDQVLHSKNRSHFFRLLDKFMSSTHLPAALVASFIKRMGRLALHGPPAGIVVVVPFIYNLLKTHPACTFMIHREVQDPELKKIIEEEGMEDPFDMEEQDPMETGAIDSCLWEVVCLQTHYHPNVATLAKIISEQFTKQSYNLEDFLDHSYSEMLEAELFKDLKKTPEVEPEIPKRIYTVDGNEPNPLGSLMAKAMAV